MLAVTPACRSPPAGSSLHTPTPSLSLQQPEWVSPEACFPQQPSGTHRGAEQGSRCPDVSRRLPASWAPQRAALLGQYTC